MTTAIDVLIETRRRLAVPGVWGLGERGNVPKEGKTCLAWMLARVARTADDGTYEAARSLLLPFIPVENCWAARAALVDYNDAPGRTLPEILALLDRAIAAAEREGSHGRG